MAPLSRPRAAGVAHAHLAVLFAATVTLAACGGGGGGGTPPPPPPPPDTTAPTVKSWTPANGATGVKIDHEVTVSVTLNEPITCPNTNPVTILANGQAVKGGTFTCDGPKATLSVTGKLFCDKTYEVMLPKGSVKDVAGNALANDSKASFSTEACPPRMVFTANYEANMGAAAVTGLDLPNDATTPYLPKAGKGTAAQVAVVADGENGTVYSASWDGPRGVDVIDVATGNTTSKLLAPDIAQHVEALALKGQYAWAAYSNQWLADPDSVNRLFMLDRVTKHLAGKTDAVTDSGKTPLRLVPHPDASKHRLYVLNTALDGLGGTDCSLGGGTVCRRQYLSGTSGTMREINSDTGDLLRTFAVGSVPTDACIDEATDIAYAVNAGGRSLSKANLGTGTVETKTLPGFTGFQQPVGIACFAGKLWVSDYVDSVRVLDPTTLAEVGKVSVGALSVPKAMVPLGDKLYVALLNGDAVVEIASDKSVLRTMATGPGPADIAAYAP